MDKSKIIELLRMDMMGEQQAIIQYLNHAYAMEEGALPAEVEAIAREEMYHLDWLADQITELGGDPAMEREPVDFSPGTASQQMLKNVNLEQVAINQYREHIALIDDEKVRRLLARILHDELVHQEQFRDLATEAAAEQGGEGGADAEAMGEASTVAPERLQDLLNEGIRHEYSVVLQYLYHSFVAEDCEAAEELQNAAINEMQHLGWLAEHLAEEGGQPDFTHDDLVLTRDPITNLEADIAVENMVTKMYTSQAPEVDDEGLKKLLTRIRDQEIYHEAVFADLLAEAKEAAEAEQAPPAKPEDDTPRSIPSVGSLKGCQDH
jgi:bacterioferritin